MLIMEEVKDFHNIFHKCDEKIKQDTLLLKYVYVNLVLQKWPQNLKYSSELFQTVIYARTFGGNLLFVKRLSREYCKMRCCVETVMKRSRRLGTHSRRVRRWRYMQEVWRRKRFSYENFQEIQMHGGLLLQKCNISPNVLIMWTKY